MISDKFFDHFIIIFNIFSYQNIFLNNLFHALQLKSGVKNDLSRGKVSILEILNRILSFYLVKILKVLLFEMLDVWSNGLFEDKNFEITILIIKNPGWWFEEIWFFHILPSTRIFDIIASNNWVDLCRETIFPYFFIERISLLNDSTVEFLPNVSINSIFQKIKINALSYFAIKLSSLTCIKVIRQYPFRWLYC